MNRPTSASRKRLRNRFNCLIVSALPLFLCPTVSAQGGLQDRPIQIVVPFTAGGNVDIVARTIARGLTEQLKRSVVVENKPGANGIIGAETVARSAPNGHTLLYGTAETQAVNPHIYRNLPYDPLADFATIGVVSHFPFAFVVSPKLPVRTIPEFVAYAKQHPGILNYASWGVGSTGQIAFEQIKQATGIDSVHVPFKGAAPAITALAAGDVEALMVPLSVAMPQAASGRVRILAITSEHRDESAPDIPTATEQGLPFVIGSWHVLAAPKGTPADVLAQLNAALNAVTGNDEYRARLLKQGVQPTQSTQDQAQAMVTAEWNRWGDVARKAGVTAE